MTIRVLGELRKGDIVWQARISGDRERLEVVGIAPPSAETQVIELLSDSELKALLAEGSNPAAGWRCADCGAVNPKHRRWCEACSGHTAA